MKKLLKKVKKNSVNIFFGFMFIFIVFSLFFGVSKFSKAYEGEITINSLASLKTLPYDTKDYVYLSDLEYVKEESYVEPGYYYRKDKNGTSGLISVNIDNNDDGKADTKETFIKGVSAWATSNIVYDITELDYDYFTAYVGVDSSQTSDYYNSGVRFTIFTSVDGKTWQNVYTSGIKKGWDPADSVKIKLYNEKVSENEETTKEKVNFIRLYAHENGDSWYSQWHDDAVYANAKLIKEDYEEVKAEYKIVKHLDEYDTEIKEHESDFLENNYANLEEYELTLLQREFVNNVGYENLQALFNYSKDYQDLLTWLLKDEETLELYLLGGKPDGNYVESLNILKELFKEKSNDFQDESHGLLYKKMAIALSLTHSASVGSWVSGAPEDTTDPNGSDALNRYDIFKKLYENNKLENAIFENLSVEEMRFVMNNIIADEEIEWLNNFARINNSKNPYTYINYDSVYNYNDEKYYDLSRMDEWNNTKHNGKLEPYGFKEYNLTYRKGYPKLWIVFEEGAVCGGLSKTGSNIHGSYGVPSTVVSQPGHAAYIYMELKNGKKVWSLYNDVYGWGQSGKTEKLSVRMPNGWGDGDYVGAYPASYVLLAQAALDDYENYQKSEKILMSASAYSDKETLRKIYEEALSVQEVNFDAWLSLVNSYINDESVTQEELYNLAERIAGANTEGYDILHSGLKYFPLPMHDLLRLIDSKITSTVYGPKMQTLIKDTLTELKNLDKTSLLQESAIKQVASYLLLSNEDKLQIATFTFTEDEEGNEIGKIKLADRYQDKEVKWEYNLTGYISDATGQNDWQEASGLEKILSAKELEELNEETDILVRMEDAKNYVYDVSIERAQIPPELSYDDMQNTIKTDIKTAAKGYDKTALEWKLDSEDEWQKLDPENLPDFSGDKNVEVRIGRHKNFLESSTITFTFTGIGESDKYFYVPLDKVSVSDVSSEEVVREDNKANNVLDNNHNTIWHTLWDGSDEERYIVLKLQEPTYISALEYIPRQSSNNGIVTKAKIYVSDDGEDFVEVETSNSLTWAANINSKYAIFKEPILTQYVKLYGEEVAGDGRSFMSASGINLFEDATGKEMPTAEIEYSINERTNKDVVAKLVNANKKIEITNNDGKEEHTFTENGDFTFEFTDSYGNKGSAKAEVTWIDKEAPVAKISYSTTNPTNGPVTATISSDEEIKIINNEGNKTFTFNENGTFEFIYEDDLGNKGSATAKVTWIGSAQNEPQYSPSNPGIEEPGIVEPDINNNNDTNINDNNTNNNVDNNKENETATQKPSNSQNSTNSSQSNNNSVSTTKPNNSTNNVKSETNNNTNSNSNNTTNNSSNNVLDSNIEESDNLDNYITNGNESVTDNNGGVINKGTTEAKRRNLYNSNNDNTETTNNIETNNHAVRNIIIYSVVSLVAGSLLVGILTVTGVIPKVKIRRR